MPNGSESADERKPWQIKARHQLGKDRSLVIPGAALKRLWIRIPRRIYPDAYPPSFWACLGFLIVASGFGVVVLIAVPPGIAWTPLVGSLLWFSIVRSPDYRAFPDHLSKGMVPRLARRVKLFYILWPLALVAGYILSAALFGVPGLLVFAASMFFGLAAAFGFITATSKGAMCPSCEGLTLFRRSGEVWACARCGTPARPAGENVSPDR